MLLAPLLTVAMTAANPAIAFKTPTVEQYRAVYQQMDKTYRTKQSADFNVFADMLANGWINAHREEAISRSKGSPAKPEYVWELPYANDWLGCIGFNIIPGGPAVLEKVHFATFNDEPVLFGWIKAHKDDLDKDQETQQFGLELAALPDIANQCEELVRKQPPAGASNL